MSRTTPSIPLIGFSGWGDGTGAEAKRIGDRFYTACRDVGFAYLTNHGVPTETIEGMFAYSKEFFELPTEVKMTVKHPPDGDNHR